MILAGDIGGTNVRLALFERVGGRLERREQARFPSREFGGLEAVLEGFISGRARVEYAGFGIAGPVRDGRCEATNLPWVVDSRNVAAMLGLPRVALLNDLQANGAGISELFPADFAVLNEGRDDPEGNGALISAGTGLGEALLLRERGGGFRPLPSEGGHSSFAPRNAHEIQLLESLSKEFGHVSNERILSGPGLGNLYRFERRASGEAEPEWLTREITERGDPAPAVTEAALTGRDGVAVRALHRFAAIYGAEAGNLALKALATGGIFVGGGIAPRILPFLDESFFGAFCDKGRFATLLAKLPVRVILNPDCALLGAARAAHE